MPPVIESRRESGIWIVRGGLGGPPPTTSDPAMVRAALVSGDFLPGPRTTGVYDASRLSTVAGTVTFDSTADGAVIRDKLFTGKVNISCIGATWENCWFKNNVVSTNIRATGNLMRDCTLDMSLATPAYYGNGHCFNGHGMTLRRCDISKAVDGIGIDASHGERADVVLDATWLHDLVMFSPDTNGGNYTHNDLIQWFGGAGLTIFGSRLDAFYEPSLGQAMVPRNGTTDPNPGNPYYPSMHATSCLMVTDNQKNSVTGEEYPCEELQIEQSWINGGAAALNLSPTLAHLTGPNNWIKDCHLGWDHREGQDQVILARPDQVLTISGNKRWGSSFWSHGAVTGGVWVPSGMEDIVDPFDPAAPDFNLRKAG